MSVRMSSKSGHCWRRAERKGNRGSITCGRVDGTWNQLRTGAVEQAGWVGRSEKFEGQEVARRAATRLGMGAKASRNHARVWVWRR